MLKTPTPKTIKVAFIGSPNVGKSTIFNMLTGLSQHVGNWPGKTVEQKTGMLRHDGREMSLVDLPGTYSLSANSLEEQIARDYLVTEKPDVVVAVLNAASLERNLYLVAELLELSPRLIIALNMIDVARQQGMKVDPDKLAAALGIPVIGMTAAKNQGLEQLVAAMVAEAAKPVDWTMPRHVESGSEEIKDALAHLESMLGDEVTAPYPRHWAAMKLLEGDSQINQLIRERLPRDRGPALDAYLREHEACAVTIATLRFEWIGKIVAQCQEKPPLGRVSFTEKVDRAATHPAFGPLILVLILAAVFGIVYSVGIPLRDLLDTYIIQTGKQFIFDNMGAAPAWLPSLLADGVLGGAGTVITFIPILFFFFVAWGFLEDVGYTARAAFISDKFMHLLGLHGKSVLPLVLGFGCNVPAVMGARIIESQRARLLTILLAPMVPCTGRMAVIALIAAAFFGPKAILVSLGIIIFSLVVLVVSGLIMNRFIVRGEPAALIMELPLYHLPHFKVILLSTWRSLVAFVKRAGTVILGVSVAVWLLAWFPGGGIESSYLAQVGRWLEPVGDLMGLGWQMIVALLSSFVAKENTIATLGVLTGGSGQGLTEAIQSLLTPASALAFLAFQVLFIPCVATVAVIRQETRSWLWTSFSLLYQLALSIVLAIAVYQIARLFL